VAQEKAIEISDNLKSDLATKARASVPAAHSSNLPLRRYFATISAFKASQYSFSTFIIIFPAVEVDLRILSQNR
jgi:hypothetical protein